MDDARAPGHRPGRTALARLELRVTGPSGHETVLKERRWPDPATARDWCERTVAAVTSGASGTPVSDVIEIQVFEERWRHAKSWEQEPHRPVAERLQLGVLDADGRVLWGEPRSMTPQLVDRLPR